MYRRVLPSEPTNEREHQIPAGFPIAGHRDGRLVIDGEVQALAAGFGRPPSLLAGVQPQSPHDVLTPRAVLRYHSGLAFDVEGGAAGGSSGTIMAKGFPWKVRMKRQP